MNKKITELKIFQIPEFKCLVHGDTNKTVTFVSTNNVYCLECIDLFLKEKIGVIYPKRTDEALDD